MARLATAVTLSFAAAAPFATFTLPAHADAIDSHDELVQQLIEQQHAVPMAADCAAHAAFVVPTSPYYDHVEFLSNALDEQHATVESWGQPFDDQKQRITVDTVVTISGLGYRKGAADGAQPDLLTMRCGYVADKLLAFGYNEPAAPVVRRVTGARANSRHAARGRHGAHSTSTGTGKKATTRKSTTSKAGTRQSGKPKAGQAAAHEKKSQ